MEAITLSTSSWVATEEMKKSYLTSIENKLENVSYQSFYPWPFL
jgi:hypothetical protein